MLGVANFCGRRSSRLGTISLHKLIEFIVVSGCLFKGIVAVMMVIAMAIIVVPIIIVIANSHVIIIVFPIVTVSNAHVIVQT